MDRACSLIKKFLKKLEDLTKIFSFILKKQIIVIEEKKNYISYQINEIKVESIGRTVNIENKDQQNLNNILIWHFIWSKFYFTKKSMV